MDNYIKIKIKKKRKKKEEKKFVLEECGEVISLTCGDQGENHVGMDKVGSMVEEGEGFNLIDLKDYIKKFKEEVYVCELYSLNDLYIDDDVYKEKIKENFEGNIDGAFVLVIRNGIDKFLKENGKNIYDLYKEMNSFEWDRKYYDTRRKKVLNKNARANVCFGDEACEPDYENKKGRVVGYENVKCLSYIMSGMKSFLGEKFENMICEGNRYFDLKKCGIGWHGDAERRKVAAFRLGETMDLHFNWFYKYKSFGKTLKIKLNNGDMYLMSEKATGCDWKRSSIPTLRHAAGKESSRYLRLNR
jgi:hypothetical protein